MIEKTPEAVRGVDIVGVEAKSLWGFLQEQGHKYLDGTGFVIPGQKIARRDIGLLRTYYQKVFDYQVDHLGKESAVFNESLHEHLELSGRYAIAFAKRLNLDPTELEALAYIHDFGRMVSHRRGRNDRIGYALMDKLKIKDELRNKMPSDTVYSAVVNDERELLTSQLTGKEGGMPAVLTLIDILAKYKDSKNKSMGLRSWKDTIEQSKARQNKADKKMMWPSEYQRQEVTASDAGLEGIETKYEALRVWFEERSGVSIDDVIDDVKKSLVKEPLSTSWREKVSINNIIPRIIEYFS